MPVGVALTKESDGWTMAYAPPPKPTAGGHAVTPLLRNIPNVLTAVRVLLAPLTAYLIVRGNDLAALGVFAVAGASDAVDGFLARRFGLVSRFGEYLDPAADKLLMLDLLRDADDDPPGAALAERRSSSAATSPSCWACLSRERCRCR